MTVYVLLMIGAVLASTFVVYYHLRARWQDTPMGKHLMAFMLMLALVLDFTVLGRFIPQPWRDLIAVELAVGLDVVLAQRLWLLVQAQRGR